MDRSLRVYGIGVINLGVRQILGPIPIIDTNTIVDQIRSNDLSIWILFIRAAPVSDLVILSISNHHIIILKASGISLVPLRIHPVSSAGSIPYVLLQHFLLEHLPFDHLVAA